MLYVKEAKFKIGSDAHYNAIPIYGNIVIADTWTGKCKRLRYGQLIKSDPDDLRIILNGIVGAYYDAQRGYVTFVEVDPDDWEKYQDCYESADNAPNPASTAAKFYGGFSFFGLDFGLSVYYGSDSSNTGMEACVFSKSDGKNFVRLEKGFVVYNDELYARKTNEVEEIFG